MQQQNLEIRDIVASNQDEASKIDQIARIRGWFRPQDDNPYYPIVQDYLNGKSSLEEASAELFGPIDQKIIEQKLDDVNFFDLWYSIIHSARRIPVQAPHSHDAVVALVDAFKHHKIEGNGEYNYLYHARPDFITACRETYNDAPAIHSTVFNSEISAWANANYFFARITANDLGDLSIFAIWALRQALETPHEKDEPNTAAQAYDTHIPAAAAWIIGMRDKLFAKEEDLTPTDRKYGNPAKGGPLWDGKAEFSKARWAFWKERFAEVGKMDFVSDKTTHVARNAVEYMERAETFERV